MASAEKTLRLIFPDWQHGANPGSGFVPRFLASIAPQGEHSETVNHSWRCEPGADSE